MLHLPLQPFYEFSRKKLNKGDFGCKVYAGLSQMKRGKSLCVIGRLKSQWQIERSHSPTLLRQTTTGWGHGERSTPTLPGV